MNLSHISDVCFILKSLLVGAIDDTLTTKLTGVLHLHVGERLQRVLEGDPVQVQTPDAVVRLLGVGDELFRELLDLLGGQVPTQPVLGADRHRAAKDHLTWR